MVQNVDRGPAEYIPLLGDLVLRRWAAEDVRPGDLFLLDELFQSRPAPVAVDPENREGPVLESLDHLTQVRDHVDAGASPETPEVYDHDAHYYLDWRIMNAVAMGRMNALSVWANEMAATAGKGIDC